MTILTCIFTLSAFVCVGDTPPLDAAATQRLTLIGSAQFAGDALDASGLPGEVIAGFPHARLGSMGSGIDALDTFPGGAHVVAINDRGPANGIAPFDCRFQKITLRVDAAASPPVSVALDGTVLLRRADGKPFIGLASELGVWKDSTGCVLSNRFDPEAIRHLPSGNLLISEEYMPGILEFTMQGAFVRAWPVPESFRCAHPGASELVEFPPANMSGRQPNKGLEGLAITPKGVVWALLQNPLIQDGALNAKNKPVGKNIRMLCVGSDPAKPDMRQVVYQLESPANGVSELLAIDENRFLVLERDGAKKKFRRVYQIDVSKASDVSKVAALASLALPEGVVPVTKSMLLDLADPANGITSTPEKIEGLCFGPTLSDGRRTLVISSDNDMKADEPSWFWVFAMPLKM